MGKNEGAGLAELWRTRISEQPGSGLSISDYCSREGFSTASFYIWRKRLGMTRPQPFVEARIPEAPPFDPVEVEFPGGLMLRFDQGMAPERITALVQAVRLGTC